jgi:cytosolic carboxypeptidase protein 5
LTTCTPHRTPAALPHSLSGRQTPISPYPALHSVLSSQESLRAPEAAHFYPTADAGDSTAVVSAADNTTPTAAADVEEDPDDLLVERIIRNPHKMGQGHGSCEKTHPPREASHSRSSPEENASRSRHIDHTPRRIHSPSCGLDVRTGRYRQGRRQSLSPSSFSSSPTDKQERNKSAALAIAAATDPLSGTEVDDADWVFQRPPNNQRTFYFKEDNLEFSSQFDSGNLIQVERVGPFQYRMYTAMDCGNAPWQTNNRQWFHFSLRGGGKGVVVTFTFVGMMHSSMFNFDWMPVTAVTPSRPEYARLVGKAKVEPLENMPETPGYPLLVHKEVSKDDADSDGDNNDDDNDADNGAANICSNNNANTNNSTNAGGGVAFSISATNGKAGAGGKKSKNKKKKKFLAMNLTFEYKVEAEVPVTHTPPKGRPDVVAIYIASNHPYSYSRLQRNLLAWQEVARKSNATRSQSVQAANKALASSSSHGQRADAAEARAAHTPSNTHLGDNTGDTGGLSVASKATMEVAFSSVYYHREVLCKTLEGHDVTLLTISDRSRMTMERAPLISEKDGIPYSSAKRTTERPFVFSGKKYVVLTARVHPGECPGSHLMHGCIEFLLNCSDPRAAALRHNFVFYIVPMLNPDGVVRGHSRVDANGVDLNRMYRAPSRKRHPAPYSVMALLKSLNGRVALFVDMHAHANKRGTFFYGNSMGGVEQVENLLYAKLVSVNTPYLDFRSCNFSEANMFAVGKSGKGKDSSSRVVVYTEAGIVHGYTVETSHVMADALNPVVTLVDAQGEHVEKVLQTPLQLAHTPATFGDTGRAMLVALLDLKNVNPVSRLPFTPYHSTRGVSMWLQRQLQIETAELLFAQAFKAHGKEVQAASHETGNNLLGPILRSLTADEFPDKITIKKARLLPRTTYSGVRSFLPMETAVALLSQTSPTGPPRSFLYASAGSSSAGGGGGGHARRRGASPATGMNTSNAVTAAVTTPVTDFPAVIATKRRSRPNAPGADMMLES